MKVETKKIDNFKREMRFEIPKDRVAKELDEIYQELTKVAKIKGFRPGKAPRHVIEAHHQQLAREEVIKKLIPEVYQEGLTQEKLTPLDLPEIHDVSFKDGIITFTAKLEIKPDVVIKEYKGIDVKRKSSDVTDEEIKKTLEYIQKGQGKEGALDDSFARGLGYPNLDEYKKALSKQIAIDKDRYSRLDIENQVIEHLLKKAKLSVPPSIVKKQLERRVDQELERLRAQKLSDEELKKKEETLRTELKDHVEKDIKVYLIFDKIAELEKIHVHQGDNLAVKIMEFLLKEAKWG